MFDVLSIRFDINEKRTSEYEDRKMEIAQKIQKK